MKKRGRYLIYAALIGLLFLTELPANVFGMLSEPAYIIPVESSIFTFRSRRMNPGSGDWWQSGEDRGHYYFRIDSDGVLYYLIPKSEAFRCDGFEPEDPSTWCTGTFSARRRDEVRAINPLRAALDRVI